MHRLAIPMRALLALSCVSSPLAAQTPAVRVASLAPDARAVTLDTVRLSTGIALNVAERGDASGPAVILLHGYSDTWYSFSRILPLLPAGVRAIVPDQRGHGDSERPATGYAMRQLAADVIALMDARGIERATIVGHSMGSLVAQQVALAVPGRVSALVLIGSGTAMRRMNGITQFDAVVDSLADPVPLAFTTEFQASTVSRPMPPEFMARVSADSRRLPAHAWRALMAGMLDTPAATGLTTRPVPTLLLWGERDAFFPRSEQDALLRMIPGSRLVTYPASGHAPHWELPEAVAGEIARVLK
jgi:non-heme chloroperoxidase